MNILKKCENCGGAPVVFKMEQFGEILYSVECSACLFFSNAKFRTKQAAIDYWNAGAKNGYLLAGDEGEDLL